MHIPEISPLELAVELQSESPPQLLDVREAFELDISRLENVKHIPMDDLPYRLEELDHNADWVIVCRTGNRSGTITHYMLQNGFRNVRNLRSGMNGWADTVDPTVRKY